VLARRSFLALVYSGSEGTNNAASELRWLKNVIDETPLSGHIWVIELVFVVGDELLTGGLRI
jgi:hypothetical protein